MKLAGFARIAIDLAVCGGRPIIVETRLRVSDVGRQRKHGRDRRRLAVSLRGWAVS